MSVLAEDSSVLTNWHQRALFVEVQALIGDRLNLAQIKTPCPWCGEGYHCIMDRKRVATMTLRTVCGTCGQFFRVELNGQNSEGRTVRIQLRNVVRLPDSPAVLFSQKGVVEDGEGLQG